MRTNFETQSYYCRDKTKNHLYSKNLHHFSPEDIFARSVVNNCSLFRALDYVPLSPTLELIVKYW